MSAPILSVLDLSPIVVGSDAGQALRNSLDLARHAERLDYRRYWLAEHHNMPGIASAATAVAIGYVAGGTSRIRVGAGGIMLPNHAPLVIAEQFGTLASLYPGRIDLGLGRAPGTDQRTARALRRERVESEQDFPRDVIELQAYFRPVVEGQAVQAVPGGGLDVPLWLLGSSLYSAQLAAYLGLPFAFASHFAPGLLDEALSTYRELFRPSAQLARPYAAAGLNVFAAETDAAAARLFTSLQMRFLAMRRGKPGQLEPPVDSMDGQWTPMERAMTEQMLSASVVGSATTVRDGLSAFLERTGVDEVIATSAIYDHAARLSSYDILADARDALTQPEAVAA